LDERVDDVACEGGDQGAEREGYDQAHRDDDHVTAHQKVLESPHVLFSDPLDLSGWVVTSDHRGRAALGFPSALACLPVH
jgi:hypothetical protein